MRRVLRATEAAAALGLAWLLVFVLPFRFVAGLLGLERSGGVPADDVPADQIRARAVAGRVLRVARRLPPTTCLVRALAGWLMLRRRGIGALVRLGVRSESGRVSAHAWLVLGQRVLMGGEEAGGFQPIADAGHRARSADA